MSLRNAKTLVCVTLVAGAVLGTSQAVAQESSEKRVDSAAAMKGPAVAELTQEQLKFFESKIRPILVTECYRCHSQQTGRVEGSLRVDNAQSLRLGGDSGPAIDHDDFAAGTLWQAINYDGFEMPPGRKLPQSVIADFQTWLESGAPDPRQLELDQAPSTVTEADIEKGRDFWSLQPVVKPELPAGEQEWSTQPIDRFLAAGWQAADIASPNDADSSTVLRRLCFDLLGVPPTAEQIVWFADLWQNDPEKAIAEAADRMLASDKFGERWGRHWLDIARYAESTGKEVNSSFPNAWRYRDYVIDSLNADKPYDQFLKEQLAGDLLPVEDDQQWTENLIATGFLAVGPKSLLERSQRQFEADLIDEQIDVTTRSLIGISVACARCHDHKFEAITQRDYYALAGVFSNMDTYFGGTASRRNRNSTQLIELPIQDQHADDFHLSETEIQQVKDEIKKLDQEIAELNRPQRFRGATDQKPDQNQAAVNQQQRRQMVLRLTSTKTTLQNTLDSLDRDGRQLSVCMGVQPVAQPVDARLLARGEVDQPGDSVPRGLVSLLAPDAPKIPRKSSGRLELANWVASDQNPLTSRVMANRIWLHLMGEGIVRTPEDFGVTGAAPSDPQLLDYLAARLVEENWSIKSMIREIVTSRSYRISSEYRAVAAEKDPENYLFWRRNAHQLDAESMRDAMLMVSGQLDTRRPRGSLISRVGPGEIGRRGQTSDILVRLRPPVDLESLSRDQRRELARKLAAERGRSSLTDEALNQNVNYRSIYLPVARDHVPRVLDLFDFAEPSMVIGKREQSQTAPQSLFLMNNDFVWEQSVAMAQRVREESSDLSTQVDWIFRSCYGRPASSEEIALARSFMEPAATESVSTGSVQERPFPRRGRTPEPKLDSLAVFCQAILASAEFRFVY